MADVQVPEQQVSTQIRYINTEWRDRTDAPVIGTGETRRANTSYFDVEVLDGRPREESYRLETSGFELVGNNEPFHLEHDRSAYRQRMIDLVCDLAGADEAVMMMDQVRTEDQSDFNFAYSRFAHCDYNLASREAMSRDLLARRNLEWSESATYVWYNTWHPFDHVVEQNALTVLDVRSIEPGDVIDYRYSGYAADKVSDRGALVAAPVYNPRHRWVYFSDMTPREVLVSKQSDARPGHTRQVPHTSFIDATRPEDVAPRRSIETRILAILH